MTVQTPRRSPGALGAVLLELERTWLWTWTGASFGYRVGDSLFTLEGLQVGRFVDREIYDWNGDYLGETGAGADGTALATNLYKRSRTAAPFRPVLVEACAPRASAPSRPFYSGYEDFPPAAVLHARIAAALPADVQRALRARRRGAAAGTR
jgi:hypothetical protein